LRGSIIEEAVRFAPDSGCESYRLRFLAILLLT
jgi:hypothetical protein